MKYQIIKADTCGCMVKLYGDDDVYYIGDKVGSGYAYQDKAAFRDKVGICYIPYNSFMDEFEMDENVPDEIFELINRGKVPSGAVAMDDGFTYDDLIDLVFHWAESDSIYDNFDSDEADEFCDYVTTALFANLVTADPCDLLESWNVRDMVKEFSENTLKTTKQNKEL